MGGGYSRLSVRDKLRRTDEGSFVGGGYSRLSVRDKLRRTDEGSFMGGGYRSRTDDLLNANQVL